MKSAADIGTVDQFGNLELLAKQVVEGFITGLHKSPFHGFSVEFAEHRLYNKGESTKHIDWKLYARTEKLFVKKFEEETNLRCQLLIDISSSMLFPYREKNSINKLQFSSFCAAALTFLLRKQRDAVGLSLFSDKLHFHSKARLSAVHAKVIYNELDKLVNADDSELNRETGTSAMLHQIAESIPRRSLVVIFSDMFSKESPEAIFSALQHLRYNKHEVILFHVTDKSREEELNFNNRPYKFIDLETADELKLNPNDIRDQYTDSLSMYFKEIQVKCGQYKIDLVQADINKEFSEVLLPFLIKRSRLY
ncbi:MAG: DUF58 domain-containing protein [Marinilabiliales bacterium]|nr:MAG: DUF58 domain-containing protein [Marinilabiliales bacterium]